MILRFMHYIVFHMFITYVMIIYFLYYFPFFRECLTAPDVILYQELYLVCLNVAGHHVCYPHCLTKYKFTFQAWFIMIIIMYLLLLFFFNLSL